MIAKISDFVSLYWRVAISPLGAVLLSIAALDATQHQHPRLEYILLVAGVGLTIYGGISASDFSKSNKRLSEEITALRTELERRRQRRIFLILAAFKDEFQIELNNHLMRISRERDFVIQVFCPSADFSPDNMLRSQEFVVENRDQYVGGLMIASQFADDNLRALSKFARDVKLPVIFIDHVPPPFDSKFLSNVSWVAIRDSAGGEQGVKAVVELEIEPKNILVVAGPAKRDRQDSFRYGIKERWPECAVRITIDGGFNRRTTEEIVRDILAETITKERIFDVIFCTSDTMTLGCLDAMQSLDWNGKAPPHVIGYDGIEATRRLILRRQTSLKRVVVQDSARLAGVAIQELEDFRSGGQGSGVIWVEPTLFPG